MYISLLCGYPFSNFTLRLRRKINIRARRRVRWFIKHAATSYYNTITFLQLFTRLSSIFWTKVLTSGESEKNNGNGIRGRPWNKFRVTLNLYYFLLLVFFFVGGLLDLRGYFTVHRKIAAAVLLNNVQRLVGLFQQVLCRSCIGRIGRNALADT